MLSYSLRNIIIGYSMAVVVVLLILFFTFFNLRSQEKELAKITKARNVLQKLEPGLMDIQEFKSDIDNFLFFGKEKYPGSRKEGLIKLQEDSVLLAQLAGSSPEDREEYRQLVNLIHEMTGFSTFAIHSPEMKSPDTITNKWQKNSGDRIVSEFKIIVYKLEEKNRKILSKSYALTVSSTRKTLIFVSVISIVLILVLLISFLLSYRDVKNRLNYNLDLVKHVNEKTAEIKESEERYRTLVDQASDVILVSDQEGNFLDVNEKASKLLGYTKEQLLKMNISDLYTPGELAVKPIMFKELFRGERTSVERNIQCQDGLLIPVDITAQMLSDGRIIAILCDISERKKGEEELKRSQQNYSTLINTVEGIVWEANAQTFEFSFVSKQAERLLGYPVAQWINEPTFWRDHIYPDDQSWVVEYCVQCTREMKPHEFEYRMIAADGRIVWLRDIVTVVVENNKPIRLRGLMVDISEQKKAEEIIKKSNERFEMISATTHDAIWEWNLETNEMWANETHQQLYGLTLKDAVPDEKEWEQRIHPDEREAQIKKQAAALASTTNVFITEYRFNTEKYGYKNIYDRCYIVRNTEGKGVRILGSMMDITERKQAEEALMASEKKYRSLVEQAIDAIALYDAKGKILDVNTGSVNLLRYTKEELLQMNLSDILTKEEIKIKPVQYDVLQKGNSTVKQRDMMKKDGSVVQTEVRSQQLPDGRFLSVIRDLTDRINTEKELAASYDAIRKLTGHIQDIREEERKNMAREIHDELGQQLTVLKMDVSWLNKRISGTDDLVKQKLNSLLTMLDETVKTVRRISSELRPSLLDDLGLISAIEWQLEEFEKRSGINTGFVHTADELELSNTIKTALFRIFQESLTNVARHSDALKVTVIITRKGDTLVLSIADNGKGFDKQEVAAKRTLGILGMKERAAMAGGLYEIKSEPGKGTEVVVKVKLSQQ